MATKDTASGWLVTGASRGLGRAIALELAGQGASLVLCGRSHDDLLETADLARGNTDCDVHVVAGNLTNPSFRSELAAETKRLIGDPIGLVNNAGFTSFGPVFETDETLLMDQVRLNISALLELTHAFAPAMERHGRGYILNLSSVAAFQAVPNQAVYAATKAWVLSFSCALHDELESRGVHVTALCPGLTRTSFFESAGIDLDRRFAKMGKWMSAEETAAFGINAVKSNRMIAIPGFNNRMSVHLQRIVPRRLVGAMTRWVMQ